MVCLSLLIDIEKSMVHSELDRVYSQSLLTSIAGCVVKGATLPKAAYRYLKYNTSPHTNLSIYHLKCM